MLDGGVTFPESLRLSPRASRGAHAFVLLTLAVVSAWAIDAGFRLLLSGDPWNAHGADTVWTAIGALDEGSDARRAAVAALRRLGAYCLYSGVLTLALAWLGHRERRVLTVVLVAYSAVGPAFLLVDATYFAGTPHFAVKQALGALWTAALAAHFWPTAAAARSDVVAEAAT